MKVLQELTIWYVRQHTKKRLDNQIEDDLPYFIGWITLRPFLAELSSVIIQFRHVAISIHFDHTIHLFGTAPTKTGIALNLVR